MVVWLDWTLLAGHADVHRFVTHLTRRWRRRAWEPDEPTVSLCQLLAEAHRTWHGVKLHEPDWRDVSHSLALSAELPKRGLQVYVILKAYREALDFELPPTGNGDRNP